MYSWVIWVLQSKAGHVPAEAYFSELCHRAERHHLLLSHCHWSCQGGRFLESRLREPLLCDWEHSIIITSCITILPLYVSMYVSIHPYLHSEYDSKFIFIHQNSPKASRSPYCHGILWYISTTTRWTQHSGDQKTEQERDKLGCQIYIQLYEYMHVHFHASCC